MPPIPPDTETSPPTSLTSRLFNIFVAPGEVFAEVKAGPHIFTNWLVPAMIFVLASWCAAGVLLSQDSIKQQMSNMQEEALDKQFQKQVESGQMTQAQADQIKAAAAKYGNVGKMVGLFFAPAFHAVISPFWGGFVVWLGALWIFKRPISYLKAVEVAGLPMMILAVGALVRGLLAAAMGNMLIVPGPILLVKHYDPTNTFHQMLMTVEVFGIWAMTVRGVGMAKLCGISAVKGIAWVIGVWITLSGAMFTASWAIQKAIRTLTHH